MFNDPRTTTISLTAVENIREAIIPLFTTDDTTLDWPEPGHFRLRGRFLRDTADCYDDLRLIFEQHGFTPMIRQGDSSPNLIGFPHVLTRQPPIGPST